MVDFNDLSRHEQIEQEYYFNAPKTTYERGCFNGSRQRKHVDKEESRKKNKLARMARRKNR